MALECSGLRRTGTTELLMLLGWLAQGMQVPDWAALTCLFVVKPNACQRRPQSQARIPSAAGVEPKGGVPALESLQRPAWRAAGPARGLAAADAACAGLPIRGREKGPQRRGAPGSLQRRSRTEQRQRIIALLVSPPRGMGPGRVKWFHSRLPASGRWRRSENETAAPMRPGLFAAAVVCCVF